MKNELFLWVYDICSEEDKYFKKKESKPILPDGCAIPELQRLEIKRQDIQ